MRRAALIALSVAAALGTAERPAAAAPASPLHGPRNISQGPDDSMWVTDDDGIVRVAPDGRMRRIVSVESPRYIARGPDGSMWFTLDAHAIGHVPPGTTEPEYFQRARTLGEIAAGPDGNMWFTEDQTDADTRGRVARITPAGEVTEFAAGLAPDGRPFGIASGADGNVWFTDLSGRIGRITPQGAIDEFELPDPEDPPFDIAPGPGDTLWFGTFENLGRIATDGRSRMVGGPYLLDTRVAAGSGGEVWVTGWRGTRIAGVARVAPGEVKLFTRGFTDDVGGDVAVARNGRDVWVLESGRTGDRVARFTPGHGATEFPPPPPCRVPSILRYPLAWARPVAHDALCKLDAASRRAGRERGSVALSVSPPIGSVKPYGTALHVEFGQPPPLPRRCKLPFAARREASTSRVLVYSYPRFASYRAGLSWDVYGACMRPDGRHRQVWEDAPGDNYTTARDFVTGGRFVAYVVDDGDHYGGGSTTLNVFDVAHARLTYSTLIERHDPGGPYATVGDHLLSRHGALAWFTVEGRAGGRDVVRLRLHREGDKHKRTLDSGALEHLRFDGDVLRWTRDGRPRHYDT